MPRTTCAVRSERSRGYADLLLDDPEMAREEREDFTRRISDTAKRMAEMVQNLLDANRIERGEMKLNLAPTDFLRR